MKLGIVGHAADKFTLSTEAMARAAIRDACLARGATAVVSGGCHLGGVDLWAEDVAKELGIYDPELIFKPKVLQWNPRGQYGFMRRNLDIASHSDLVLVVVVRDYPPGFKGERFGNGECYHCKSRNPRHVKSGACWTAWKAKARDWKIIEGVA